MRINFGCGTQILPGYFNIDAVRSPLALKSPDMLHALVFDAAGVLTNPLPLADGCATEVHAYHVLEHVYAWEAPALVAEWCRLLVPNGRLILELPNLEHACHNVLSGMPDQWGYWPLYGDPHHKDPYMCHRWAYTPKSLTALLASSGLKSIQILPPQTHGARTNRDMRAESVKV